MPPGLFSNPVHQESLHHHRIRQKTALHIVSVSVPAVTSFLDLSAAFSMADPPRVDTVAFFLIGGQLLYNIVLVAAIRQYESAMRVHVSPPV